MEESKSDGELKLKSGELITSYTHYTAIAEGEVDELGGGFECPKGKAFMGMKIWADSFEECADVYQSVGKDIGFHITGDIEIYITDPKEAPSENPSAYDTTTIPKLRKCPTVSCKANRNSLIFEPYDKRIKI